MRIKTIIRKNLLENHDLIRHDDSSELLGKATNSLTDAVRYLECLTQKIENKHCTEALIKVLDMLRHPMGNVSSDNFDEKNKINILSMLEMLSSIISLEKLEKENREKLK